MNITANVYLHGNDDELLAKVGQLIDAKLAPVLSALATITTQEVAMSQALIDKVNALTEEVAQDTSVIGSAVTLLDGLMALVKDLGNDPTPEQVQALSDALATNRQALADAVLRNTPSQP